MMPRLGGAIVCGVGVLVAIAAPPALAQPGEMPQPEPGPAQGQSEVGAGQLSKLPKQTKFVEAAYPSEALARGLEADVMLLLDIGADGKVSAVGLAEPSASPGLGFEEAALAAAPAFEFEPAEQDGKPIAVQLSYRYKFRLKPKEPAPAEAATATPAVAPRTPVANFTGELIERGTRLPLAGVLVTVFHDDEAGQAAGFEATSDAAGRFAFYDLAPGAWRVSIEAPGYYPFKTGETLDVGEGIAATYHLERGSYNPYDVTISAPRPRKEVSRTVLSAAEIDKVPGTAGDPLAVIQDFAGVARGGSPGELIVRGSAPEDSRIFVDGGEVPLIFHFGSIRSVLPIGMLDSIEFYPGNFSPRYGRATGGIVDVQVKQLAPKKVGGYADVSILDTGVFLEVPLGDKGGIAVAGRRSYIDAVINLAVPDDADVAFVTAPVYYDYQLLANYRPARGHDVRGFLFGSDDRLEILFKNPADLDPKIEGDDLTASTKFYRTQWSYRYTPGPEFDNNFEISQGRNWTDFKIGQLGFEYNVYTTQIRDTVRHAFGDAWALTYGADVLYNRGHVTAALPPPPQEGTPPEAQPDIDDLVTANVDLSILSPAGFVEVEWKPLQGLLLLPGLRVERFGQVDQWVVQPRLTARAEVTPGLTIKGGVGLFSKAPEYDETDPSFGNPDLKAERALHYSAGVEYKPRPYVTFDVTGFYKQLFDLVSPTDRVTMRDGMVAPLRYDNGGKGRVYGAEVTIRHEFANNFSGWLAYTISRAERRDTDADSDRLFDFDQTHILTAVGNYQLPRNWQVGFRFRLVSGNPRTPVVGSVYDASADTYEPIYGGVNSARNSLFHQLDLRVDKRWIFTGWMLTAYLDVQNVYSHENEEGLTYNYNYPDVKPQYGLPILPILGIRAEF